MWNSPDHAKTLRLIADTNAEAFYRGELADKIDEFLRKYNGYLRKEDLQEFETEWVKPISIIIFIAAFIFSYKYKIDPILLTVISGIAGFLLYTS